MYSVHNHMYEYKYTHVFAFSVSGIKFDNYLKDDVKKQNNIKVREKIEKMSFFVDIFHF